MKANELRIGNLIYWDITEKEGIIHEVVGIKQDKPLTIPISLGDSMVEYKPIPLTEEWLVKFGFQEGVYWMSGNRYIDYRLGNFEISKQSLDEGIYYINASFPSSINYVHQLQNLYFALTGNELVWKK